MKFFVYEHVVGGGFLGREVPPTIVCEAYGMLRTLTADLKSLGHEVALTLDRRLKIFNLPATGRTVYVSSRKEREKSFEKLSSDADAAVVIAPEAGNSLLEAVRKVEAAGCPSLNCPSRTLKKFSSKSRIYKALRRKGVRTPNTVRVGLNAGMKEVEDAARSVGYPVVVKPDVGAGCSGLSLVRDESQLRAAVRKVKHESASENLLVQEFVDGVHASVSLICNFLDAKPLTLNRQWVVLSPPASTSSYLGGVVPFNHPYEAQALMEAERAAEALVPLRGYVGVDLVLTGKEAVVIEVNPRLTTSYVGLRMVTRINIAKMITDVCLRYKLPGKAATYGYSVFSKIQAPMPLKAKMVEEIQRLGEVVSPPIQTSPSQNSCMLIATHASTLKGAERRLRRLLGKLFMAEKSLYEPWQRFLG